MNDRLYRSTTDRVLTGVAGGLAAYLNVDPSLVRVAWVILAVVTGGIALLVYIVMVFIVPEAPPGWVGRSAWAGGGPAAWASPQGPWEQPAGGDATGEPAPGAVPGWEATSAPTWGTPAAPRPRSSGTGTAGIVFGVILIALGVWFLVREYVDVDWDLVWPVVIIGLGALLIAAAMRRRA